MPVGIVGTFDVENYGDLLFPLIAQAALADHAGPVIAFSPEARTAPPWPYDVRASAEIRAAPPRLAALLIGGGHIIRFDSAYPIPAPDGVVLPDAYWLDPALACIDAGVPVIWNAPGVWTGTPRTARGDRRLALMLEHSRIIAVRDAPSRDFLNRNFPGFDVEIIPDTAFGLSSLWPFARPSAAFEAWRRSTGVDHYMVVQADPRIGRKAKAIDALSRETGLTPVLLPICTCQGDDVRAFSRSLASAKMTGGSPGPLLTAEIIANASLVVASSLHASITAISYGVPLVRVPYSRNRKFELLNAFEGVAMIAERDAVARVVARGRRIEDELLACQQRLDAYWQQVGEIAKAPPITSSARISIEASRPAVRTSASPPGSAKRLYRRARNLAGRMLGRSNPMQPSEQIARPAAYADRPILNLDRIGAEAMHGSPFRWGRPDGLFGAEDAALLARTFPRDGYREVDGSDGEKSYSYVARSLIHMGADAPTAPQHLSPAWRALALDLLSDDYRAAFAAASGLDLDGAVMEANLVEYGPGAWLGPHVDLAEKIATQIFYFNQDWPDGAGGHLEVLAAREAEPFARIAPNVGTSALLVRSEQSWHAVAPVAAGCPTPRRSLNVIFHRAGSVSTMWPPGSAFILRDLPPIGSAA